MSITMKDIAKIAGVSQATVSRCLNDSDLVSEKTKELVKKIAMEQGFEFNASARSLSTSKTGTIGVIYPNNFSDFSNSLYLTSLHNQLRDRLEKENLDLILSFAQNRHTHESNIKKLVARKKVDGLIIMSEELDLEILSFLKKTSVPSVFMHRYPESSYLSDFDVIGTDHERGGYIATQYLIELGHRNLLCISAKAARNEFEQRTYGFLSALRDNGLENNVPVLYGDLSFSSGYQIVMNNTDIFKMVTAVFAQNDLMALGVIEGLRNIDISVPECVSVIGYDDIELCEYFRPHLTTIHQPREEVATLTCNKLLELIGAKRKTKPRKIILQPKLVVRDSCKKLS